MYLERYGGILSPASRREYLGISPRAHVNIVYHETGELITYTKDGLYGVDGGPVRRYGLSLPLSDRAPHTAEKVRNLLRSHELDLNPKPPVYFYLDITRSHQLDLGYQVEADAAIPQMQDALFIRTLHMMFALGIRIPRDLALPAVASQGIDGVKYRILRHLAVQAGT